MPRYVAFLRGINLGGRRVKNDELREHFAALGFDDVAPFIASGNVIFDETASDPSALESRIEGHLVKALGFESETFLRRLDELRAVADDQAIAAAEQDGFKVHVIFLRGRIAPEAEAALKELEGADDRFHIRDGEVVWFRRGRLTDSPITDRALTAALGTRETTMRNLNTVRRIVAKFGDER